MPYHFRNADGDEVLFIHRGTGRIETDFGPLDYEKGDLSVKKLNLRDIRPITSERYHLPPTAHCTFMADNVVIRSREATRTEEKAIMVDTRNPLHPTAEAADVEMQNYWRSWMDDAAPSTESGNRSYLESFVDLADPVVVGDKVFLAIDHLTHNVVRGTRDHWADFYKNNFGFTEVRYFDIRGAQTGLTSFALRSPDGSFCIPINEGTEEKSQIEEYLREYRGPGVQHLAFLTTDLLASLDALEGSSIETLDIDDDYYETVYDRVPDVREDRDRIRHHNVLVDGDADGYLLQIFTKNIVGPIFIEMIQRKNHFSFGEGNFSALFRSIERDQQERGVL